MKSFDQMIGNGEIDTECYNILLLTPSQGSANPDLKHISVQPVGNRSGHLWEQFELPAYSKGGLLFCPGNTAPCLSLRKGNKTVVTLHDLSFIYFPQAYSLRFTLLYAFLVDQIIRYANCIITVSSNEKKRILSIYPQAENKLHSVPSAVRWFTEEQRPAKAAGEESYILFVGSMNRIKNLENLLEAIFIVHAAFPVTLKVVGGGSSKVFRKVDLSRILRRVKNIEFLGQIDDRAILHELYVGATMLVMPSYTESFGFPCIEAMSSGCPVLASEIGGLRSVCGEAAVYCDPYSPVDIAEKIYQLWHYPKMRAKYVELGYKQARQFTWERTARETWKILASVADS